MIFIDNKYTKWYNAIIHRALSRKITGYTETHHIIPRSIGGSDEKSNLVELTAKEHFICHILLVNMLPSPQNQKLVYAAWCMANLENDQQKRYKISGRIYQKLREEFRKNHGELMYKNNPMHDPLVREKHTDAIKKRGKTKGNTGKKRGPISDQLREILSQRTQEQMTPERREQIRQRQLNRTPEEKEKYAFAHSKRMSCVFCRKQLTPGNFNRWHGNNCKLKM